MRQLALLLGFLSSSAMAQQAGTVGGRMVEPEGQALPEPKAANVRVPGVILEPRAVKPDAASLARLEVPQGFNVGMFAQGLGNARLLAVADDGTVYLTRRAEGDVVMLRDTDGDGRAEM
nr:hypothetical protein [Novosphingobium panipatense]